MKIVFAERGFTPEQVERAYAATVSKEGHADIAKILTALEEARDSSPSAQNSPLLTASEGSDVTVTPTAGKQGKNTAPVVAVRADDDIYFLPPGYVHSLQYREYMASDLALAYENPSCMAVAKLFDIS